MKFEELNLIIKEGEGLTVEFKEKYTPKIDRDIVAFTNSKGGLLLFGVNDNGKAVGEKLTNKMKAEITNLARHCEPAVHVKSIKQFDKIIVVEVAEGNEKPYSCSSGYYRRLDAVTQKMTQQEIRLVYKNVVATSFEERVNKDVSFSDISEDKIKAFFKEAGVHVLDVIPQDVLSSLSLTSGSSIKNAGILFFAKEPRRVIMQCELILVAFKGKGRVHIYDKKYVQDDLLTQFNEAMVFLEKHLNVRSEIKGANRKDIYEMPLEALREAVANAIMHRDYSMRGTSIMVEVHEDRVVINNPGGLPEGLKLRDVMNMSVRRNELIADIFARMDKVERMGTGIRRMRDAMKSAGLPYPEIESGHFFTITFQRPPYSLKESEGSEKSSEKSSEKILVEIRADNRVSAEKIARKLGISSRAVEKQIANLKAENKLKRIGSAKGGHWEIISNSGISKQIKTKKD